MNAHCRDILLFVALAVAAARPALAQTEAVGATVSGTHGSTSIPDFSGIWRHPSLPGFEPPASGPGPVVNKVRRSGARQPGASNYDQLVGDHTNPILKPRAAKIVREYGEISLSGATHPNPANQCWPEPMPFIFKQFQVQIIQQPDKITFLYNGDHEVRRVRLNQPHFTPVTPSWYGDSVGHYEGDTLVIDTVGVRTDRPFAMIDLFGTPYTKSLHVVERYRLREYDDVKDAIERNIKENWLFAGDVFSRHRGKFLQLHLTIEDDGVFTTPWTATLTYVPVGDQVPEEVCAENVRWFPGTEAKVPTADKPDF